MFPICPACQQSVLDDDAENCPFCGANMKTGKGGGKAPAPKAASKSAAKPSPSAVNAPTPAANPKSAPGKMPAKGNDADSDDPFGVDAASNSRAIPLSPRPAKGKTVRLSCPMCETFGFAGADVAGKEVKCCNENCALPIFTAPKGEGSPVGTDPRAPAGTTKTIAAPQPKKISPAILMTAVGSLLMAGGSLWFFVLNEPAGVKPPPPPPQTNTTNNNPGVTTTADPTPKKATDPTPAEKARSRGEELRKTILPVMVDLSREPSKNRSKHVCRRLTAEAYVEAGDMPAARANIADMLLLVPKLAYHQVPPLTQIAWRERGAGNAESALAAMEAAWKGSSELPPVSRLTFDTTTDLAALLFVSDRTADAQSLMKSESVLPSGSSGTLCALARRSHLLHTFEIDEAAASLPVIPWKSPQWVVTTITLVLRGEADKGVKWLKLAPDAETKADCWGAWGDAVVAVNFANGASQDEPILAALKGESPVNQARVWARVAAARLAAKQPAAGNTAVAAAATALQSVPLPKNFVMPDMKEVMKQQLPDAIAPRINAISAAEVARSQAMLGQTELAAKTLTAALQHLRGHAPSSFAAGKLFDATSRDPNTVKAQLKKALDLKTDDKVQQALTTYREKCRLAFNAGNARFALQTEILKAAVDWPLVEAVWTEATAHSADGTPDESREDFLKTNLSVRLGQRLRALEKIEQAQRCENAVTTGELTDVRDTMQRETAEALQAGGDVASIAQQLSAQQIKEADGGEKVAAEDTEWPLLWGLRLACRLAKSGQTDKAFDLVGGFTKDMLAREEGYEMLAARVAKDPVAAETLWKKYRPSLMTPTEKIAIFRGLCAGLSFALDAKP
ncbi:MAG: hypothetical protein ACKV2Q_21015 [Planctomycetaceae bacterium]